jgi:hypothetical protein
MLTNYKIEYTSNGETFKEEYVLDASFITEINPDFFKELICSKDFKYFFNHDTQQECDVVITKVETF